MTAHLTEEQQVEALKRFWKEYGLSIIIGVVLALVFGFGWRFYQQYKIQHAQNASMVYERVVTNVMNHQVADAKKQAAQLRTKFSNTPYATLSALALAKLAIANQKLDEAVENLNWVVQHGHGKAFKQIAQIRLARIYLAERKPDLALNMLEKVHSDVFAGLIEEIRGDAYVAKGQINLARQAYQNGLSQLPNNAIIRPYLQMKLHNLH